VAYTDAHRLFLQACIIKRVVTEEKAHDLYRECCNITNVEARENALEDFITAINDKILGIDMEFRKSLDEMTGSPMWVLVNTRGDDIAQIATEYTAVEIAYFKHLVCTPLKSLSLRTHVHAGSFFPFIQGLMHCRGRRRDLLHLLY